MQRAVGLLLGLALCSPALAQGAIYRAPLTADGRPDLQGVWTQRWITPLERQPESPSSAIPKEEAPAFERMMMAKLQAGDPLQAQDDYDPLIALSMRGEVRTSLIVNPPSGLLPYAPEGRARRAAWLPNRLRGADNPEQRGDNERCIGISSAYAPYLTAPIANIRQIIQTPDHLVIYTEHYIITRIIPFSDQPPQPGSRHGQARAHWEGDTLVVVSTGFRPDDGVRFVPLSVLLISPATKITERFTRISDNEILYRFTVDDALLYSQPWTAESIMSRSSDRMFEYACHEGNYGLPNILSGGRTIEREAGK